MPLFYFLNPMDSQLLDAVMQSLWNETQYKPLGQRYWSCTPYLLGERQAVMYSFVPKNARRNPDTGNAVWEGAFQLSTGKYDQDLE